jgi:hypothetical protein
VLTAVIVMGDRFGVINALGLGIVISGVCLFNYYKWQKMRKDSSEAHVRCATGEVALREREVRALRVAPVCVGVWVGGVRWKHMWTCGLQMVGT